VELTQTGGLGLGFRTMPYLFQQWGPVFAAIAGIAWFGLLFFAGITSSLAMGTPIMGFLRDEFGWSRERSAWTFGATVLILGAPTVFFFNYGVFDEYDYWAGTVSLVVFAMFEIILFAWVFGMDNGWAEINRNADMKVPVVFKYIIKYVTPVILISVFLGSLLSEGGIIDQINNKALYAQIAATTDPMQLALLEEKLLFVNGSRLLLVLVFAAIGAMVYRAQQLRERDGRALRST
jgi:NSS family neurotransmitter:Na+ symporter